MNHIMTACKPKPKIDYTDNGEECTKKCGTEGKVSILEVESLLPFYALLCGS